MTAPAARCETCRHWCRTGSPIAGAVKNALGIEEVGTCQIDPPQLYKVADFYAGLWPETHASRWCRMWQAREDGPESGERQPVDPAKVVSITPRPTRSATPGRASERSAMCPRNGGGSDPFRPPRLRRKC